MGLLLTGSSRTLSPLATLKMYVCLDGGICKDRVKCWGSWWCLAVWTGLIMSIKCGTEWKSYVDVWRIFNRKVITVTKHS